MNSVELVLLALAVRSARHRGLPPAAHDVEILRQHALPAESDLDIDELACAIVRREIESELLKSRIARSESLMHRRSRRERIA